MEYCLGSASDIVEGELTQGVHVYLKGLSSITVYGNPTQCLLRHFMQLDIHDMVYMHTCMYSHHSVPNLNRTI